MIKITDFSDWKTEYNPNNKDLLILVKYSKYTDDQDVLRPEIRLYQCKGYIPGQWLVSFYRMIDVEIMYKSIYGNESSYNLKSLEEAKNSIDQILIKYEMLKAFV